MKSIIKSGLAGICLLLASKAAKADEIYVKTAQTQLNTSGYNDKIGLVSVGGGFGSNVQGSGIGYRMSSEKFDAGIELTYNSQKVDALKEEIATGKKTKFGEESLAIKTGIAEATYKFPAAKKTSLELSAGISLSQADLSSSNESETKSWSYILPGIRIGAGVKQGFSISNIPFFARLKASYNNVPKLEELDISNSEVSIELGGEF